MKRGKERTEGIWPLIGKDKISLMPLSLSEKSSKTAAKTIPLLTLSQSDKSSKIKCN